LPEERSQEREFKDAFDAAEIENLPATPRVSRDVILTMSVGNLQEVLPALPFSQSYGTFFWNLFPGSFVGIAVVAPRNRDVTFQLIQNRSGTTTSGPLRYAWAVQTLADFETSRPNPEPTSEITPPTWLQTGPPPISRVFILGIFFGAWTPPGGSTGSDDIFDTEFPPLVVRVPARNVLLIGPPAAPGQGVQGRVRLFFSEVPGSIFSPVAGFPDP